MSEFEEREKKFKIQKTQNFNFQNQLKLGKNVLKPGNGNLNSFSILSNGIILYV